MISTKTNSIEEKLKAFESAERSRLEILPSVNKVWVKPEEGIFTAVQRGFTTMLVGGLTIVQDYLIQGALNGLGYKVEALECPDNDALRYGKEYGNKGQCNPTYYTVGNLVKYLTKLRDKKGISTENILNKYVFITAGACGPCRFGMYEAEYRKALQDAGFDGFRVLIFDQSVNNKVKEELGLNLNFKFTITLVKAIILGDILNALGYKIRPYEVIKGSTDKVIEESKNILYNCFINRKLILPVLNKIKKKFQSIEVNYFQAKPVVDIIGEFWAMTTEGDGNYAMKKWLENEGAEVHIQQVAFWLSYLIWEAEKWNKDRLHLKKHDKNGLNGKNPKKMLRIIRILKRVFKMYYYTYARLMGLKGIQIPDMKEIEDNAKDLYNTNLSGGEGHMEVGKVISTAKHKKSHMVLSIKPFGCMPSSGVSDGVQSRVQEMYPNILFYAIETTGDGAVNVYSRVQMILHKARQKANKEFNDLLKNKNITLEEIKKQIYSKKKLFKLLFKKSDTKQTSTSCKILSQVVK